MKTWFISGHRDITELEFATHYIPLIEAALTNGDSFVVGDYRGADAMAQKFLKGKTPRVVVYHMYRMPRYNLGKFPAVGSFPDDEARDSAMTRASNGDIAWVREGKRTSGTAQNLARRKDPKARIYKA